MMALTPTSLLRRKPSVSVISLAGVISASARGGLSLDAVSPLLNRAFRKKGTIAVALKVNSPGGSPVQSSLIGAAIRRLAEETSLPVHAFVEDVAASGGYWLAAAADDIWVDESSVTGSIGVISAGFGFVGALEKLGVERRVHTAGEDKSLLDPFRPERAADVERLIAIQSRIHQSFIGHVKNRRGEKLASDRDLFTGDVFVGAEGVEVGLADGIAHLVPKVKELYGEDVRFRAVTRRIPFAARLLPSLGRAMTESVVDTLDERALYARLGL